jgi:4-amino-4-deoxy-L-arabinose transferase-like glycosyltransferase
MNRPFWLFLGLVILTCVRLFIIGSIELSPDESYYLLWSEHPDVCYYSKGPGVAAAIWISTHLFGVSEFGVRFFSPLLSLGTSLLLFSFARRLYSESIAIWTVVLMNFLPIFQVGSVLMTIDPLSIFFWTAAMYAFWMALEHTTARDEPDGLGSGWSFWWPVTGALIGLGFLCKWTNAIQLVSILALLLSSKVIRNRFSLRFRSSRARYRRGAR